MPAHLRRAVLLDGRNQFITRNLTPDQLAQVQIVQDTRLERIPSAEDFFLRIEASRIRLAYQFDPQLAVSISQVDPLFSYDDDLYRLFIYHELNSKRKPLRRCTHAAGQPDHIILEEADGAAVVGMAPLLPDAAPKPPVEPARKTRKKDTIPLMRNWFDVIQPHEDIRKGHFDEAVFAADLGDVFSGKAPPDYNDPYFQELTDSLASLTNGMLIVTLPSSKLEDFGDREEESLARLSKIFGRSESIETPVKGQEVYAVIRRRLFEEETLQQTAMREIAHEYFQK